MGISSFVSKTLLSAVGVSRVPAAPRDINRGMVLGCIHAPYHDKKFVERALRLAEDFKPDVIILNGDIADMVSISAHSVGQLLKDSTTLDKEYEITGKLLDDIDSLGVAVHYNFGNHEDRFNRYMSKHENSKLGGALISLEDGLQLSRRGYTVNSNYSQGEHCIKDLQILHGVYCGETAAKNHLRDSTKKTIIFNHTHRVNQSHWTGRSSYNIGWMGDPKSHAFNYKSAAEKQAWQQGFALFEFDGNTPHVTQILNRNGLVYNGKIYK